MTEGVSPVQGSSSIPSVQIPVPLNPVTRSVDAVAMQSLPPVTAVGIGGVALRPSSSPQEGAVEIEEKVGEVAKERFGAFVRHKGGVYTETRRLTVEEKRDGRALLHSFGKELQRKLGVSFPYLRIDSFDAQVCSYWNGKEYVSVDLFALMQEDETLQASFDQLKGWMHKIRPIEERFPEPKFSTTSKGCLNGNDPFDRAFSLHLAEAKSGIQGLHAKSAEQALRSLHLNGVDVKQIKDRVRQRVQTEKSERVAEIEARADLKPKEKERLLAETEQVDEFAIMWALAHQAAGLSAQESVDNLLAYLESKLSEKVKAKVSQWIWGQEELSRQARLYAADVGALQTASRADYFLLCDHYAVPMNRRESREEQIFNGLRGDAALQSSKKPALLEESKEEGKEPSPQPSAPAAAASLLRPAGSLEELGKEVPIGDEILSDLEEEGGIRVVLVSPEGKKAAANREWKIEGIQFRELSAEEVKQAKDVPIIPIGPDDLG